MYYLYIIEFIFITIYVHRVTEKLITLWPRMLALVFVVAVFFHMNFITAFGCFCSNLVSYICDCCCCWFIIISSGLPTTASETKLKTSRSWHRDDDLLLLLLLPVPG